MDCFPLFISETLIKKERVVATQGNIDDDMQQREHDINSKARFFSCVICIFHILSLSAVCEEEALYLFGSRRAIRLPE